MLGIIIIDDEVLVRVGLKSLIDWEKYDCHIIGEAGNGEASIKLIKETKPAIVITDLKMPIKDGLELIEEAQQEDFDTKFIVLSSFDEFHLVKKAMKLGAVDYLIKLELDDELLIDTLSTVKKMISKEKERMKNENIIKHNINKKGNLRKEFLKKLIGGLISNKNEIEIISQKLDINLHLENLFCMVIQLNNIDSLNKFNFEFSIINIVEEIVNDYFTAYAFLNNLGEIVVIFLFDNQNPVCNYYIRINEMTITLKKMLKQYFSVKISIAISKAHNGFDKISTAYFECCEAAKYSFQAKTGEPIYYKDIKKYQSGQRNEIDVVSFVNRLSEALDIMEPAAIEDLFKEMIETISVENLSKNKAYDLCFQIAYLIKSKLDESLAVKILEQKESFYKYIEGLNNLAEVVDWLVNIEERLLLVSNENIENEKNFIITQAQKYIKGHFIEELSLSSLAEELNISAGYLSALFREVTDIGFSEYITGLRINKAKDLLSNTNIKIYEISKMVGYHNPYYFSRVFKKTTGKTPSEYRLKKY
ncbi:MAG: helix-turn-helix domain-containing protein [Firmicutes bacterium]|nr:helix-turn-helix domain-containing protein [Bacillota bacterium]